MELARTPARPGGDRDHGYEFRAPLGADGHIDVEEWHKQRQHCTVRRFKPDQDDEHGHLIHTQGRRWVFHYDADQEPEGDESGYRSTVMYFEKASMSLSPNMTAKRDRFAWQDCDKKGRIDLDQVTNQERCHNLAER